MNFRIDDRSKNNNESKLFSGFVNELTDISGFEVTYYAMLNNKAALTDDVEGSFVYQEEDIFVTGENTAPDMNNFDVSAFFGGNMIQIFLPFKSFQEKFGERKPTNKDKVIFKWNNKEFDVTSVEVDDRESVFNYNGYQWKVVLTVHKESKDETFERFDVSEELGSVEINQDLGKLFFDNDYNDE